MLYLTKSKLTVMLKYIFFVFLLISSLSQSIAQSLPQSDPKAIAANNKNNVDDPQSFSAVYDNNTTAVNDNIPVVEFSNAYPNPVSSFVNFNYNIAGAGSAEFIITDILGSEIYRVELQNENNKLSIDLSTYNVGVYFYSLFVDGRQQFTRKLIIRR